MRAVWLLLLQLCWSSSAEASADHAPFHEPSAHWIPSPRPEYNDYFGYSITYESTSKRLIVSAPHYNQTGALFACGLDTPTCSPIPSPVLALEDSEQHERNHNPWFGASVKAGSSYFVACAPRFLIKKHFKEKNKEIYSPGTFGHCYKYTKPTAIPSLLKSITDEQRYEAMALGKTDLYENFMDSLGWSVDVADDNVFIGGPAMYTGRAMYYKDEGHNPVSLSGFNGGIKSGNKVRAVDYNYGYSVAIGHFSEIYDNRLVYAVGSPYGKAGVGKILFYNLKPELSKVFATAELQDRDEFAVGSMFGAVLASAHLTPASQLSWLVIGAPTYADSKNHRCNQGAVYLYEPRMIDAKKDQRFSKKIVGKEYSFFGSALASLGDYNGDGLDEIAIAAPYENSDTGAVYIYSSKDLINKEKRVVLCTEEYLQMITPETVSVAVPTVPAAQGFGLSLASVQDYDENGCNELAVGAPESNKVMLLKCMASVTVYLKETLPDFSTNKVTTNGTELILKSCLQTEFPAKPKLVSGKVKVNMYSNVDDLKLQVEPAEYEFDLDRSKPNQCKNIKITAPKNGNYEYPIKYNIIATAIRPAKTPVLIASEVSLSDRSKLTSQGSFWFTKCAVSSNCKPILTLTYDLSVTDEFTIGSNEPLTLSMRVRNDGEAAYKSCVRLFFDNENTDVVVVPAGCERVRKSTTILCRPNTSIEKENSPWVLNDVSLKTESLTVEHEYLKFRIGVYSHCSRDHEVIFYNKTMRLVADKNVAIRGMTDSGLDSNVNMTVRDTDGKEFAHNYIITNNGVTKWLRVPVTVVVQTRSFIQYLPIVISAEKEEYSDCTSSSDKDQVVYKCFIGQLYNEPIKVTVPMVITYGTLEEAIDNKLNTQFSSVTVDLQGHTINATVTSQLNYGGKVAIWIIVVAVLVGLLILVLFSWLLCRCGFFKRDKKQELKRVRHSVRRQTMMRRSMADAARVHCDQQTLLATVTEETAEQAAARDTRLRLDSTATNKK